MADHVLANTMSKFTGGENFSAAVNFDSYAAADGYDLTYFFRGPGGVSFRATGSATGDSFSVTAGKNATANLPGGVYQYVAMVEDTNIRREVDNGQLKVFQSPLYISWAESRLRAIESVLEGRASQSQLTVMIDGVQLMHMANEDLLAMRDYLRREVHRQRTLDRQLRGQRPNKIGTRFIR